VVALDTLGIIAGNGVYPRLLAQAARRAGVKRIIAAAFIDETDDRLAGMVDEIQWMRVGQLAKLVSCFRNAGVTNAITINPPASPASVRAAIEDALRRQAEVDARQIRVEVSGRTAKLYGHVRSMREASAAKAAAAAAPGVASVENHLVVTP